MFTSTTPTRVAALPLALALASCSNGTPSSPVEPPPPAGWSAETVLTVVGGDSGRPVAEAEVFLTSSGRVAARTDRNGEVRFGTAFSAGTPVAVRADGYLRRETLVRFGQTRFVLWPDNTYVPANYTSELVYTTSAGLQPLLRPAPGVRRVRVRAGAEMWRDDRAMDALRNAIDELNAPLEGSVVYGLDAQPYDAEVVVSLNPDSYECRDWRSFTRLSLSGYGIRGATIVYCSVSASRSVEVAAHELGHTVGLQHTSDWAGVMYGYPYKHRFSSREALTIRLMLQRPPGNRWPDDDTAASASGRRVVTIE